MCNIFFAKDGEVFHHCLRTASPCPSIKLSVISSPTTFPAKFHCHLSFNFFFNFMAYITKSKLIFVYFICYFMVYRIKSEFPHYVPLFFLCYIPLGIDIET